MSIEQMQQGLDAYPVASSTEQLDRVKVNADLARDFIHVPPQTVGMGINELYEGSRNESVVASYDVTTDDNSIRMLHMSELLLGHKDAAVDFYDRVVTQVRDLPENEKPHAIVLSGLLQGTFEVWQKNRRETLVPGLDKINHQYHAAHEKIVDALSVGVPVVYNMGNDDLRVARENTVKIFRVMEKYTRDADKTTQKEARKAAKNANIDKTPPSQGLNWSSADKMQQNPHWQKHFDFQVQHVFPYCLRLGRSLYNANEMAAITNGAVQEEEYFILFAAEQRHRAGKEPKPHQQSWIEQSAAGPEWIDETKLVIADDIDLHIATKTREYTDWMRHTLGFSDTPMYQDHLKVPVELLGQRAVNSQVVPDMLVTQNNQELAGVQVGDGWVLSTGGLMRPSNFLTTRSGRNSAAGDVSRRVNTTRRRPGEPSATMIERTDDGSFLISIYNDVLNGKMESIPDRITIAELCDLQTGSITARPDLLVKYLDYLRVRAIGERPTALFFGGDMLHGRNYSHFASESQITGVMAMDSQEAILSNLFEGALEQMDSVELGAIMSVLVQPGNHEWNSGTLKWHGYSFTTYMRNLFEKEFARTGLDNESIRKIVKSHEAYVTQKGEYVSGYTGVEYFGELGILVQHYLQDRGGKGTGGSIPAYQADAMLKGTADLYQNIDVMMAGHWHHPNFAVLGNKVSYVGGAIAGLSDYEQKRGYRPAIAGTLLHIGGNKPLQIEYVSEKKLHSHTIKKGAFTPDRLADEGYADDDGFDPIRHGIWMPESRYAHSGLQKKILAMHRDASARTHALTEFK